MLASPEDVRHRLQQRLRPAGAVSRSVFPPPSGPQPCQPVFRGVAAAMIDARKPVRTAALEEAAAAGIADPNKLDSNSRTVGDRVVFEAIPPFACFAQLRSGLFSDGGDALTTASPLKQITLFNAALPKMPPAPAALGQLVMSPLVKAGLSSMFGFIKKLASLRPEDCVEPLTIVCNTINGFRLQVTLVLFAWIPLVLQACCCLPAGFVVRVRPCVTRDASHAVAPYSGRYICPSEVSLHVRFETCFRITPIGLAIGTLLSSCSTTGLLGLAIGDGSTSSILLALDTLFRAVIGVCDARVMPSAFPVHMRMLGRLLQVPLVARPHPSPCLLTCALS